MNPSEEKISLRSEIPRKSLHLAMTAVPVWIYFIHQPLLGIGLIIATLISVLLDLWRLNNRRINRYVRRFFRGFLRTHEQEAFLGSSHFMLAGLLSVYLFEREIAVMAMAYLSLGDFAAGLIGRRLGRIRIGKKSLEGSAAFFAVAILIGLLVMPGRRDLILLGAVVSTLVEALPIPIDDNFRIPLISGLLLSLFN